MILIEFIIARLNRKDWLSKMRSRDSRDLRDLRDARDRDKQFNRPCPQCPLGPLSPYRPLLRVMVEITRLPLRQGVWSNAKALPLR